MGMAIKGKKRQATNSGLKRLGRRAEKEKGAIFITALVVILGMLLISLPFVFKVSGQYRSSEKTFKSLLAHNLAEAGVERVIWELNFGDISTWAGDEESRTLTISESGAGDIVILAINLTSSNPVVESTGRVLMGSQTVERTVRVVLHGWEGINLANYGLFADDSIELYEYSLIDSYDSTLGEYDEMIEGVPNRGSEGHVGVNSTRRNQIKIQGTSELYGDAYSGPDSDPERVIQVGPGARLYGEKQALSESKEMPSVTVPNGLPDYGDLEIERGETVVISESGEYEELDVGRDAVLRIEGEVALVVEELDLERNSRIEVAEGGRLTLFIKDTLDQDGSTWIGSVDKDPSRVVLFGADSCRQLDWRQSAEFYGVIYAPRADVRIRRYSEIYGSIVAEEIELQSGGAIHYDLNLRNLDLYTGNEISAYVVKSWQIKQN